MGVPEADRSLPIFLHEHPGWDPQSVVREGADSVPQDPHALAQLCLGHISLFSTSCSERWSYPGLSTMGRVRHLGPSWSFSDGMEEGLEVTP